MEHTITGNALIKYLPAAKDVLEPLHVDQFAAKPDPFYLQASSLLVRRSTA